MLSRKLKFKNKILIASKNIHKMQEIKDIFMDPEIELLNLNDMQDVSDIEETGTTFEENAIIKAKYYYEKYKIAVIADDSGLVVPALNGEPGVYSARYAGPEANYKKNNEKLIKKIKSVPATERNAYFVCHAIFYDGETQISVSGEAAGIIIDNPKGENGFGYDPIFYVPDLGKTYAELESIEKNKCSHRYFAFSKLGDKLKNYYG